MAGGLAHELRNPLSTLKVNLQLLSEEIRHEHDQYIDSDIRRRMLLRFETLTGETDRLQKLLDNFLRLVTRQELNRHCIDVNTLVSDVLTFYAPEAVRNRIQIRKLFHTSALVCSLDREMIHQALLNLILNAAQSMPDGGELMVTTRAEENWALVEITDTGTGIEPEVMSRIFDPFFSTKKGGTGLGLSVTRRIVQQHGGLIDVQSTSGRGTRFTVRLPLYAS